MTKVIVLSTVLGLSALGMACGDSGTNVNVNAKPANSTNSMAPANTMAPSNTMAPANTMAPSNSNSAMNSNMKPSNSNMTPANSNMKPANTMTKTPVPSPTKKP